MNERIAVASAVHRYGTRALMPESQANKQAAFASHQEKIFSPGQSPTSSAKSMKDHAYAAKQHRQMAETHRASGNHSSADAHTRIAEQHESQMKSLGGPNHYSAEMQGEDDSGDAMQYSAGSLNVGDHVPSPNGTYKSADELNQPKPSYVVHGQTGKVVSIHSTPAEAIHARNSLGMEHKVHFGEPEGAPKPETVGLGGAVTPVRDDKDPLPSFHGK